MVHENARQQPITQGSEPTTAPVKVKPEEPRKTRHVAGDVDRLIEHLAIRGWKAIQIYEYLKKKAKEKPDSGVKLPSLRTVQARVKAHKLKPSAPWTLTKCDIADPQIVLRALAAVIPWSKGRIKSLSVAQAEWVTTISRAAPDLPPLVTYVIAWLYQRRTEDEASTANLDYYLSFGPWRGENEYMRYEEVLSAGYVPRAPTYIDEVLGYVNTAEFGPPEGLESLADDIGMYRPDLGEMED